MILDGAEVISISKKADFGTIKYTDNSLKAVPIKYLAICKYENSEDIHLFLCNENMDIEQDNIYESIEDAKKRATEINRYVSWEDGIKYINFDNFDFQGGNVNYIEGFGEDMLEIFYPNGYMIDVGYYDCMGSFYITIVKNEDWNNIINEVEVKTDIELKKKLKDIIQRIKAQ